MYHGKSGQRINGRHSHDRIPGTWQEVDDDGYLSADDEFPELPQVPLGEHVYPNPEPELDNMEDVLHYQEEDYQRSISTRSSIILIKNMRCITGRIKRIRCWKVTSSSSTSTKRSQMKTTISTFFKCSSTTKRLVMTKNTPFRLLRWVGVRRISVHS